ncbi:MAG TPA: NAD(P)H-binding protein [Ktedonobacterales bacterium]|nr:NAD(P)H-binding protein [Ktedonobacterales bacterium]
MIVITGADGFVGRHIVARLTPDGEPFRALVRNVERARRVLPAGTQIVEGDTTRPTTLGPALEGADTVIHCAFLVANRKERPGATYREVNLGGTKNLVAAAQAAGVGRICVMGGLGTVPSPHDAYVQGRYEANEAVKQSGLGWAIIGPSVQFGPHSAFFSGLAGLIRSPLPVVPMIGDGSLRFQPIWVEDVVTCMLKMVREPDAYNGREIDIGGPEILTYRQILALLMRTLHKRKLLVPGPKPLARLGAGIMEAVLPNPPVTRAATGLFDVDNVAGLDSVERNFGFAPLSLRAYLADHGVE